MCRAADRTVGAPRHRTYVAPSTLHGRGVFAAVPIAAGDVVEECPVLRFPAAQRDLIGATLVDEYYFEWDGDGAIALGLGSLYNHSDAPVAEYLKDTVNDVLVVRALSAIAAGEEITFSYSGPAQPEVGPDG
ncbi:MAG: nuclear protein [Chloroflexi bacterium]|jgi:SET domain-containing protein|nr:nuclear protein [Chloroflexota bacterium]